MYAVIRSGGKQYRVTQGDVLEVESLPVKGDQATFTPILVVTDKGETIYGAKELRSFAVSAKVLGDTKGDKVAVFKYRPKSGYATRGGHRQRYSLIEITSIGEKTTRKEPAKPAEETKAEAEPETETPAEETE